MAYPEVKVFVEEDLDAGCLEKCDQEFRDEEVIAPALNHFMLESAKIGLDYRVSKIEVCAYCPGSTEYDEDGNKICGISLSGKAFTKDGIFIGEITSLSDKDLDEIEDL